MRWLLVPIEMMKVAVFLSRSARWFLLRRRVMFWRNQICRDNRSYILAVSSQEGHFSAVMSTTDDVGDLPPCRAH